MFDEIYKICCNFHPAIGLLYAPISPIIAAFFSRFFFVVMIKNGVGNDEIMQEIKYVKRCGMVKRLYWIKKNMHILPTHYRIVARFVFVINYSGFIALAWSLLIIFGPIFIYSRPL